MLGSALCGHSGFVVQSLETVVRHLEIGTLSGFRLRRSVG